MAKSAAGLVFGLALAAGVGFLLVTKKSNAQPVPKADDVPEGYEDDWDKFEVLNNQEQRLTTESGKETLQKTGTPLSFEPGEYRLVVASENAPTAEAMQSLADSGATEIAPTRMANANFPGATHALVYRMKFASAQVLPVHISDESFIASAERL